ncbi:MAG: ATP-binding protein [bacterium]|nr:ATP-binding protein [bacterium]
MYIERQMGVVARELAASFPVLTLTGPRQSGKTTMARHCFPQLAHVNLEEPQVRAQALADPRGFFARFPEGMLLDEIQRAPDLLNTVQVLVDADGRPGRFLLTGSEQVGLRQALSQSLAGRTALLHLLPLSLAELSAAGLMPGIEDLLFTGFYPRVHAAKLPAYAAHAAYIQTYLERDVRLQGEIRLLSHFQRFLTLCAGRVGQLLNLNALAGEVGVAASTLREWLSVLEAAYVVFLLPPWHANLGKRLVKSPKLYFHDVGLAAFLLGVEEARQLVSHPLAGALFENMVVAECIKARHNRGLRSNLSFYRDHAGHEVDLVADSPDGPLLVEIKSSRTLHQEFTRGFAAFEKATGREARHRWIVYAGENLESAFGARAIHVRQLGDVLAEAPRA